jgi:hypothetical protein
MCADDLDDVIQANPNLRVLDIFKRTEKSLAEAKLLDKHDLPAANHLAANAIAGAIDDNEITQILNGFFLIDEDEEDNEPAAALPPTTSAVSAPAQGGTYVTKLGDTLDSVAIAVWGRPLRRLSPLQEQELRRKVPLLALQDKPSDAADLKVLPAQHVILAA